MKNQILYFISSLFLLLFIAGCNDDDVPKPRTFMRIDIPAHGFQTLDSIFPFTFRYSTTAVVENTHPEQPFWINIVYPKFNVAVYLSYYKVDTNLRELLDDAQELAYKHQSKANDIRDNLVLLPEHNVYGLVYNIKGVDVASPLNFYLTDSTQHYIRAAVYFNLEPNNDSLAPVIKSIQTDMDTLIKSLRWK